MTQVNAIDRAAEQEEPLVLRMSDALRRFVDFVGRFGSWMVLPLVLITVLDVVARKIVWRSGGDVYGMQIWLVNTFGRVFESTLLQELEWHFHTALFALVLGYGYIYNTHVRVDLVRETLAFRKRAWLEFLGLTFFMIPYCLVVVYFATIYTYDSWSVSEISASTVGLSHRWLIKGVLVIGLITAGLAGVAVWLQVALVLFGDPSRRFPLMTLEWPEEEFKIEGKERIVLQEDGSVYLPEVAKKALEEYSADAKKS